MKWEYFIFAENWQQQMDVDRMNELGAQGWELVSASPFLSIADGNSDGGYENYYFKRPLLTKQQRALMEAGEVILDERISPPRI
jgi:hypothetical protein